MGPEYIQRFIVSKVNPYWGIASSAPQNRSKRDHFESPRRPFWGEGPGELPPFLGSLRGMEPFGASASPSGWRVVFLGLRHSHVLSRLFSVAD